MLAVVLIIVSFLIGGGLATVGSLVSNPPSTSIVTSALTSTITSTSVITSTTTIATGGGSGQILQVCFAKVQQCDTVVIHWINAANRSIYVEMYTFTSDSIRDALIAAHNRGIDVKIVVDVSESGVQGSEYTTLKAAGINILLDGNSGLLHDKVAIIDNSTVITGSYNWSAAAENSNDENMVVLQSQPVTNAYLVEFNRIEAVAIAHA